MDIERRACVDAVQGTVFRPTKERSAANFFTEHLAFVEVQLLPGLEFRLTRVDNPVVEAGDGHSAICVLETGDYPRDRIERIRCDAPIRRSRLIAQMAPTRGRRP